MTADPGQGDEPRLTIEPICVSAEHAARLVGLGVTLFRTLVDEGRLPAPIVVGRRRLWSVQALREWAAAEYKAVGRFTAKKGG